MPLINAEVVDPVHRLVVHRAGRDVEAVLARRQLSFWRQEVKPALYALIGKVKFLEVIHAPLGFPEGALGYFDLPDVLSLGQLQKQVIADACSFGKVKVEARLMVRDPQIGARVLELGVDARSLDSEGEIARQHAPGTIVAHRDSLDPLEWATLRRPVDSYLIR